METLLHRLWLLAESRPTDVFCRHLTSSGGAGTVTFADLADAVERAAMGLVALGVRPGEVVPLVADNGIPAMTAFLAVNRAGAIPAFMPFPNPRQDPAVFAAQHGAVFLRLGARLVISSHPGLDLPAGVGRVALEELVVAGDGAAAVLPVFPGTDDVALLQHSSGTTGLKKGVALSHRAVLAQVDAYAGTLGFGPEDRVATWLPLYHDMGLVTGFLMPLALGASVVSMSPFDWVARPALLLQAMAETEAGFCWLPNFAFGHLARAAPRGIRWPLDRVRAFISCSETTRWETIETFLDRFADCGVRPEQIRVSYAMAENVFAVTQTKATPKRLPLPGGSGQQVVDCGLPIPGVELRIAEPDAYGIGEILLSSPFLFDGYHRQPDLTARCREGRWYRTGDMGFLAEERLYVTGRRDDRIIVYGRNLHAYDIELVAQSVSGIIPGRTVALGLANHVSGTQDLVLIAETEGMVAPDELRRRLREVVTASFGISPHRTLIVERGWVIKTTSGKVSRTENMKKYLDLIASAAG